MFIHLPADRHLSCIQFGDMNKAVMNTWVQVSVWPNSFPFFLLNKYPEVEWLDSMTGVGATVKDTAKVFFTVVEPFYIPLSKT